MKWKHSATEGKEGRVGCDVVLALFRVCGQQRETVEMGRKVRGREGRKIGRGREGNILICTFVVG